VPRGAAREADVPQLVADGATISLAPDLPPLRKVSFRAGRKDSVATVAARYRVSASQVAQWNQVGAGAKFSTGQMVVVYTPAKAVSVVAKPAGKIATRGRPLAAAPNPPIRVAINTH